MKRHTSTLLQRSANSRSNTRSVQRPSVLSDEPARLALGSGNWTQLRKLSSVALAADPQCEWARRFLPFSLSKLGLAEETDAEYQRALAAFPLDEELQLNFAKWLLEQGNAIEATPLFEKLSHQNPDKSLIWSLLACSHYQTLTHDRGFKAAQNAVNAAGNPLERSIALQQLAIHRRELGQIDEAIADCEEALKINPTDDGHHTNRLLFMLSKPDLKDEKLLEAALDYAKAIESPWLTRRPDFSHLDKSPNRRLKVGFLSPDLRNHSVMYFTEGLLALLDHASFETYALFIFHTQDYITERVKYQVDHFVDLSKSRANLQDLVNEVRALDLDIVVDLAGHTGNNGLAAMAQKLAPVQVSTLGFPGTTGLQAMDYRISDPITDPPDAQKYYTEKLWRLNSLFCVYRPCIRNPLYRYQPAYAPKETPAIRNGYVTFGSCTNLGRITDEVMSTWARILDRVSGSKLLIEGKDLGILEFADTYREKCSRNGIDPDRLLFLGQNAKNQYLTYHDIDVVLDPFPLNSGTTSFDSVWMGVPFVTLTGQSFKGRIGTGILAALGLNQCITSTPQGYIDAAVELVKDIPVLNQLRLSLRAEMEASVLMNEEHYATQFGNALRSMWWGWACPDSIDDDGNTELQHPIPGPLMVGIAPEARQPLSAAYADLQILTDQAKKTAPNESARAGIEHPAWIAVQDLAEAILNSHTNDPVALASLAEIENAHGHTDFAASYMFHAMKAMGIKSDYPEGTAK